MTSIDRESGSVGVPRRVQRHSRIALRDPGRSFHSLVLIFAVILFTGAWYYPQTGLLGGAAEIDAPFAVPFRYMFWALAVLTTALHIARCGFFRFFQCVRLFIPFYLFGWISAAAGVDIAASARLLVFWAIMACSGAVLAAEIEEATFQKIVVRVLLVEMLGSCLVAILAPSIGIMKGEGGAWRGAFDFKNTLGWIACWSLIVCCLFRRNISAFELVVSVVLSVVAIVGADSRTSLVVAASVAVFYLALNSIRRLNLRAGVSCCIVLTLTIGACASAFLAWSALLDALGKDATLTGRTVIWGMFYEQMTESWLFGQGPGAFTAPSDLTRPLAEALNYLGMIYTPHSMYLGVFGDGGFVGFLSLVFPLAYLAMYQPFHPRSDSALYCGCVAFMILAGGITETHRIYSFSFEGFMLIALHSYVRLATLKRRDFRRKR